MPSSMKVTLKLTESECGIFFNYWVHLMGKDKNVLLRCYPTMTFDISCMLYVAFRIFLFINFFFLLAILYADRGEFDRQRKSLRFSLTIEADTPGDFFRRSRRCGSFENSCDKIAQPDGLALLAIRSNKRRKSRERAHLANAGEFNRRYLTCQIYIVGLKESKGLCTG